MNSLIDKGKVADKISDLFLDSYPNPSKELEMFYKEVLKIVVNEEPQSKWVNVKECVTLDYLYDLRYEIFNKYLISPIKDGRIYLRIDDEEYSSDMKYVFDIINIFFDVLEKRILKGNLKKGVMQNESDNS